MPRTERTRFTAWITKYALTAGIQRTTVEDCSDTAEGMVKDVDRSHGYYHGNDWHRSEAAAIARAEEMRIAKLKSLDKQVRKISALRFGGGK